jgi:cell division protein FtsB
MASMSNINWQQVAEEEEIKRLTAKIESLEAENVRLNETIAKLREFHKPKCDNDSCNVKKD